MHLFGISEMLQAAVPKWKQSLILLMHSIYEFVILSPLLLLWHKYISRVTVRSCCAHYTDKPWASPYLIHWKDLKRRCRAFAELRHSQWGFELFAIQQLADGAVLFILPFMNLQYITYIFEITRRLSYFAVGKTRHLSKKLQIIDHDL